MVEDLDDLGTETSSERGVASQSVLSSHTPLLVSGGTEWQIALSEEPVMGYDAVARGEDVRKVGPHVTVHGDCATLTKLRPGRRREVGVRMHADHYEHHVDIAVHLVTAGAGCLHR